MMKKSIRKAKEILPFFNGYTIDVRNSRFIKFKNLKHAEEYQFIYYDSVKGQELIKKLLNTKPAPLVSLKLGEQRTGRYICNLPQEGPLVVSYAKLVLENSRGINAYTLPYDIIKHIKEGHTVSLRGTSQGIKVMLSRKLSLNPKHKL